MKIALFIYLGDKDENDSVVYRDGYEKEDESLIFLLFSKTHVSRWEISKKLYEDKSLNVTFILYPNVAHTISKDMRNDLIEFLTKHKD